MKMKQISKFLHLKTFLVVFINLESKTWLNFKLAV